VEVRPSVSTGQPKYDLEASFWLATLSVKGRGRATQVHGKDAVDLRRTICRRVPQDEINTSGRVWYLPHHGVINEKKLGKKLSVVFDCAAVHNALSLNHV